MQKLIKKQYMSKNKKIGLALSGGGIRAVAHIGLIKYLEENDIHPTVVSGTSGGAIVATLYAAGCSTDEIMSVFRNRSPFRMSYFSFYKPGFLDTDKFGNYLFEEFVPHNSFEQLVKKLYVTATNIVDGRVTYFTEGDLIKILLASCALPIVFSPVDIDGKLYADGGILNNFPVEPLIGDCDIIIGSYVSPLQSVQPEELSSSLRVLMRVFDISTAYCVDKFKDCDVVFNPPNMHQFGMFDRTRVDEIFELGYEHAKAHGDILIKVLEEEEEILETPGFFSRFVRNFQLW